MNRIASLALKIGVTLLGLFLVLRQVNLAELAQTLRQAHAGWLLFALLLIAASMLVRAWRWYLLLRGLGSAIRFRRLTALYFVGSFFNAFLPSGFGGDVVRVVEAARDVELDVATGTVFLDRMTGLIMLFVMALLLLPLRTADLPPALPWLIGGGAAASLLGLGLLLKPRLLGRLGRWLPGPLSPTGGGFLAKVLLAVQACGSRAVAAALAVSVLFNLMLCGWWAAAGRALGLDVPFGTYLLVVPLLSVALLAPSVGGLGVRELLAPLLFAGAGVDGVTAVSLSVLVFALERVAGLAGAPLYLLAQFRQRDGAAQTAESPR